MQFFLDWKLCIVLFRSECTMQRDKLLDSPLDRDHGFVLPRATCHGRLRGWMVAYDKGVPQKKTRPDY